MRELAASHGVYVYARQIEEARSEVSLLTTALSQAVEIRLAPPFDAASAVTVGARGISLTVERP